MIVHCLRSQAAFGLIGKSIFKPLDYILRKKRNFGFDVIMGYIEDKKCLDIIKNPKPNYGHQHVLIILAKQYVIEVPCVIIDTTIHLVTFYVSRNAKRMYKDFILFQTSGED